MKTASRPLRILALAAVVVTTGITVRAADDVAEARRLGKAFTRTAKKAMPAVVFVRVEKTLHRRVPQAQRHQYNDPFEFFGEELWRRFFEEQANPQYRQFKQQGAGSGFLISKDGYILTNNHVVGDADRIMVRLHDGTELEAKRIGSDAKSEVAVIKIEGDDYPFLPLGDSAATDIGEWVIAIGNPFGLTESVTVGVVSAKGRSNMGITDYENFIQTDAAINPGNSGGPLLNIDGEVIGINTAIYSRSGGYMGIGFAIPINLAKSIKEQLVIHGKVDRGYLGVGIQPLTKDLAASFGVDDRNGIIVRMVEEDSGADKAGLQAGDLIVELDGLPVDDTGRFRNAVSSNPPGTRIKLKIVRDGKTLEVEAKIGSLEDAQTGANGESTGLLEKLGFSVTEITPEITQRFGHERGEGVVVSEVEDGSPADQKGLRPFDLIAAVERRRVSSVEEFHAIMKKVAEEGKNVVLMRVGRQRILHYVAIPVPRDE